MRLNTLNMPGMIEELDDKFKKYQCSLDYVIDLGAHVGVFSCLAAEKGAKLVLAVEPNPVNFQILLENIIGNGFQNVIVPLPFVVTIENWNIRQMFSIGNPHMFSLNFSGTPVTQVWSVSLWTLLASLPKVDFLKMDIDGAEWDLLSHPLAADSLRRVCHIDLETHKPDIHPYLAVDNLNSKIDHVQTMLHSLYDIEKDREDLWQGNLKQENYET